MTKTLIGPFSQIVTMDELPSDGPLHDNQLQIILEGGVCVEDGKITAIGKYSDLKEVSGSAILIEEPAVLLPGFIDSHTHLCYAGSRAKEYAMRLAGSSYQEIAESGGGILDTVRQTREADKQTLCDLLHKRLESQLRIGVTTCEVKSGYGLNLLDEVKMLEAINEVSLAQSVELIPTCLAAHVIPWEFSSALDYLTYLVENLFPFLEKQQLSKRIDIFIEKGAFPTDVARPYLRAAKDLGFSIVVHADQFSRGGALLAAEMKALSVDHLEKSVSEDFSALKKAGVIPILLPGCSLGLGHPYPPGRKVLDSGLPLVIASDWNPGSAPMGNLLMQAAVFGAAERLTMAETLAAITCRAARALELDDRGILRPDMKADMISFPCDSYKEILYRQGSLVPNRVFIDGKEIQRRFI